MHIAFLNAAFPPEEGVGYYVYNLGQELLDRGHSVTVICRGGYRTEYEQYDGIEVIKPPFVRLYPFHIDLHGVFVNRVVRRLAEEIDVLHAHEPLTPVVTANVPLVLTIHTSVVGGEKELTQNTLREILFKLTANVSSRRIVASQAERAEVLTTVATSVSRELSEHYGVKDVSVVGNGVNHQKFCPADEVSSEPYVLFVGRLAHRKGVDDFLEAARLIRETHDIKFKIVGTGPLADKYRTAASELGINEHVDFLGYVERERLVRLYQHSTVFVLPSHYEGLPTVLLEAMSCGRPVVATDVSGCPDVIDDGENGVLVPARTPKALADATIDLIDDSEYRKRLATAARETILSGYTWDAIADEYESLYRTTLENQPSDRGS